MESKDEVNVEATTEVTIKTALQPDTPTNQQESATNNVNREIEKPVVETTLQDTISPPSQPVKATKVGSSRASGNVYRPPVWAMACPVDSGYRLEVIKNGIPLPECTVNLASAPSPSSTPDNTDNSPVQQLSFCLFGRQPEQFYAPYNRLHGQCTTMAHPSISRLHAVLQYGRPPPSIARTSATQLDAPGWYLQDLDSTHGTFVNKRRLPPSRFVRIHVGHVVRFGGSTRLYLLSGPDEDTEQESQQSWTELKQAYQIRQLALQSRKVSGSTDSKEVDLGCDWGFSVEDSVPDGTNFLANIKGAACLTHEHLYQDDPKRALRAYFEREGIEPAPEFEFVEASFGKQHCRIELPLDSGTVTAEATVSGKRKEAIAACALEACRLLDRLGEFDPNKNAVGRSKVTRSKTYWEENDFYSSDEDTFIDRTGQVERKRLDRIRQLGVEGETAEEAAARVASIEAAERSKPKVDKDALSNASLLKILAELEKIGEKIVSLEEQLREIDAKFVPQGEKPSELDELEAYMNALKSGGPTRKERMKLKSRLFTLRQTEMRLFQKAGLPQPRRRLVAPGGAIAPDDETGKMARTDAAAAVRAAKRNLEACTEDNKQRVPNDTDGGCGRSTNTRLKMVQMKRSLPGQAVSQHNRVTPLHPDEPFVAEDDEDEEDERTTDERVGDKTVAQKNEEVPVSKPALSAKAVSPPVSGAVAQTSPKLSETSCEPIINSMDHSASATTNNASQLKKQDPLKSIEPQTSHPVPNLPKQTSPIPASEDSCHLDERSTKSEHKSSQPAARPMPYKPETPVSAVPSKRSKTAHSASSVPDVYTDADPDYVTWMPPSDQQGDGVTALNAKYGY